MEFVVRDESTRPEFFCSPVHSNRYVVGGLVGKCPDDFVYKFRLYLSAGTIIECSSTAGSGELRAPSRN